MLNKLSALIIVALLSLNFLSTAQATNPHLSAVPTDGLMHYQARLSELTSTDGGLFGLDTLLGSQTSTLDLDYAVAVTLLQALLQTLDQTPDGLEQLGLDPNGWATLYHVGATFMLRLDVNQPNTLRSWVEAQVIELNGTPESLPSPSGELVRLAQGDHFDQSSTYLWLGERQATLAVSSERIDAATLDQRLRGATVSPSLASENSVAELAASLSVSTSQLGWWQFEQFARTAMSTTPTLLAQELGLPPSEYSAAEAAACEAEWLSLVAQSPRLVFGQRNSVHNGAQDSQQTVIWELKNAQLQQQIGRLQGSLPNDLMDLGRTQLSVGLGLNVDSIGPVLMMWWQNIAQQPWECPTLQELQAELAQHNPATIAIAAAVMQGAQSALFELYGGGDDVADLASLDALLAVRSRDAFLLSAILTQSVPFLRGVVVPATGDPVALPLPFPGVQLQARIVGDYLTVYQGPQAAARAAILHEVPHSPAFMRFAVDGVQAFDQLYGSLGHWMLSGRMDRERCDRTYNLTDMLGEFDAVRGNLEIASTSRGLMLRNQRQLQQSSRVFRPLANTYDLAILWDDCTWESIGTDRLNADGTALFSEVDTLQGQACTVSETRYQWRYTGNALIWANSEIRYRDDCQSPFSAWETEGDDVQCRVVRSYDDGSFDCIANFDIPERFRYTPRRPEE